VPVRRAFSTVASLNGLAACSRKPAASSAAGLTANSLLTLTLAWCGLNPLRGSAQTNSRGDSAAVAYRWAATCLMVHSPHKLGFSSCRGSRESIRSAMRRRSSAIIGTTSTRGTVAVAVDALAGGELRDAVQFAEVSATLAGDDRARLVGRPTPPSEVRVLHPAWADDAGCGQCAVADQPTHDGLAYLDGEIPEPAGRGCDDVPAATKLAPITRSTVGVPNRPAIHPGARFPRTEEVKDIVRSSGCPQQIAIFIVAAQVLDQLDPLLKS
jgi:hypothetical protein